MLSVDPDVKLRLKLQECRYAGFLLLDNPYLLLDQLQAIGARIVESLALILEAGRFNVGLAAKIEVKVGMSESCMQR